MKKAISCNSFFKYIPNKPLIESYGNYLLYLSNNNLKTTPKTRQKAIYLFYNKN